MQTILQELIKQFENIKETKCKSIQEMLFFDGVLAIIESGYLEKEKNQIIAAYDKGNRKFENGSEYYNETFNKNPDNLTDSIYTEQEVAELLHTQRGNCYVAILSKTKDEDLAKVAGNAPEPNGGKWRK